MAFKERQLIFTFWTRSVRAGFQRGALEPDIVIVTSGVNTDRRWPSLFRALAIWMRARGKTRNQPQPSALLHLPESSARPKAVRPFGTAGKREPCRLPRRCL